MLKAVVQCGADVVVQACNYFDQPCHRVGRASQGVTPASSLCTVIRRVRFCHTMWRHLPRDVKTDSSSSSQNYIPKNFCSCHVKLFCKQYVHQVFLYYKRETPPRLGLRLHTPSPVPLSSPLLTSPTITQAPPNTLYWKGTVGVEKGNHGIHLKHCCMINDAVTLDTKHVLRVRITKSTEYFKTVS